MAYIQQLKQRFLQPLNYLLLTTLATFSVFGVTANAETLTFNLFDNEGPVTHESYPGKHLLLSIGYSSCPDICPTTLYEFGYAMKHLKHADMLQPLFLTIDPVNDEINRLNAYTQYFDERIVGLSGKMDDIKDIAQQLGATFGYRLNGQRIDSPELGMGYTVYHSAMVYLITPERELLDVFDYQIGGDDLVEALDQHLSEAAGTSSPKQEISDAKSVAETSKSTRPQSNCAIPDGFTEISTESRISDLNLSIETASRVQLINLWASWCIPCRKELPILDNLIAMQPQLDVITINVGDSLEKINELFTQLKINHLPTYQTENFDLLRNLGGVGLPFNALVADDVVIAIKNGTITETESIEQFAQCLETP